MTRADAELLERLVVAMMGGLYANPDAGPKLGSIITEAVEVVAAIRKAQGEVGAEAPAQQVRTLAGPAGVASALTAEGTIHALLAEVDQADAIIHALVDERVSLRSAYRAQYEARAHWCQRATARDDSNGSDDPRGATDEDPLTDAERRVVDALRDGARSFDDLAAALSVDPTRYPSCASSALWSSLETLRKLGHITSFDPTPQPEELPELWKLADQEAAQ